MKLGFIFVVVLLSICSCNNSKLSHSKSPLKLFSCDIQGDSDDILKFLNKDSSSDNQISLQLFTNHFLFFEDEEETLMMYRYYNSKNLFESSMGEEFSSIYETDRKYKMTIFDSTIQGFKMKIEMIDSENRYTRMNDQLIIDCKMK